LSWIDWKLAEENVDLLRYFRLLIQFRKDHPVLADGFTNSLEKETTNVIWHGLKPEKPDWSYESRSLAFQVSEMNNDGHQQDIYFIANAYWKPTRFMMPRLNRNRKWYRVIDTTLESPFDISDHGEEEAIERHLSYRVGPRSVVVLLGR